MRRQVTIDENLLRELDVQCAKIDKIFAKNEEGSPKYLQAEKFLKEIDYLQKNIDAIRKFENNNHCLTQDDEGCRFYEVKLVTSKELKEQLKLAYRLLVKRNSQYNPVWQIESVNRLNMNDHMQMSSYGNYDFDPEMYINSFQFIRKSSLNADYAFSRIETKLDEGDFFNGKPLTYEDWEKILDEFRIEHKEGYTSQILVSIRQKML